ncbi:DUF421 domain-containing protein [Paenibacillus thermotolerans]|uniref:DUF421 domain-containing protein n=1 Tax=Paenibacillus thermotolerans TaxID=3027807 RepID=UPI002368544C|nr:MULTISPECIES: DUF421 domain-containing protein [unclassified Paenibacillus]
MSDYLEVAIRTLVAVIFLFLLTKMLGKRQVRQLSVFEYITGITVGSLAAYISTDLKAHWLIGIIALGVWVGFSILMEFVQLKSKRIRNWADGRETVLIKEGKILENNLKKERLTTDELLQQLRNKNVFRTADVEFALMETNGDINVLLKKENRPLTMKDLGLKPPKEKEPKTLVMDRKVMQEPLQQSGYNRQWLESELEKLGITLDDVFLGQVDDQGHLYIDLFDDSVKLPEKQQKAVMLAQLVKCKGDVEQLRQTTATQDPQTLAEYEQCISQIKQAIEKVRKLPIQ